MHKIDQINNPFKEVMRHAWLLLIILSLIGYLTAEKIGIRSICIGFITSAGGFFCLCKTQLSILQTKKRNKVIIGMGIRMLLYGICISTAIYLKQYFNLLLVLISLFSFQVFYIVLEASKSILRIRQENING